MTSSTRRPNARAARRNVVWGMSSLSALVLLFGYHTSTQQASAEAAPATGSATATGNATGTATGTAPSATPSGTASASSTPASGAATSATTAAPTTVTGQVVATRYGPVQVQLTITGGQVTAVDVLQHPDGNGKDQQINARALPILVKETLSAQNSKIDMVSGATYTSTGYLTSLQSALDQAGLA